MRRGGVDSTTLAYDLRAAGASLTLVSCDYGQRHRRELAVSTSRRRYRPRTRPDATPHRGQATRSARARARRNTTSASRSTPSTTTFARWPEVREVAPARQSILINNL